MNNSSAEQYENFTAAYNTSIKIYMIILVKMFLKKNYLSHSFVFDLYNKVDLDEFME